jgi:hypothetical protein
MIPPYEFDETNIKIQELGDLSDTAVEIYKAPVKFTRS